MAHITGIVHFIFDTLKGDLIFWSLFYSRLGAPAVNTVLGDPFRLWTGRLRELFTENLKKAIGRA